jgi:hypothetical protein
MRQSGHPKATGNDIQDRAGWRAVTRAIAVFSLLHELERAFLFFIVSHVLEKNGVKKFFCASEDFA